VINSKALLYILLLTDSITMNLSVCEFLDIIELITQENRSQCCAEDTGPILHFVVLRVVQLPITIDRSLSSLNFVQHNVFGNKCLLV